MATATKPTCPNCNAEIKSPIFGDANQLLKGATVEFINKFTNNQSTNYCTRCYKDLM